MFKRIYLLLACLLLWPGAAKAAADLPKFETASVVALGGCLPGGAGADYAMPMTGFIAQRVSSPRLLTWSLEASVIIPSGIGANVLIDLVHQPKFRLHLLDPGVHVNMLSPVTARHIDRSWDLTFGAGLAWSFAPSAWLTVDYRMFMPEPSRTIRNYGNLILETVNRMPQEGQLWFGLSYSFSS